jgi:hypothetical protein
MLQLELGCLADLAVVAPLAAVPAAVGEPFFGAINHGFEGLRPFRGELPYVADKREWPYVSDKGIGTGLTIRKLR